jgi:hypothetical protein
MRRGMVGPALPYTDFILLIKAAKEEMLPSG